MGEGGAPGPGVAAIGKAQEFQRVCTGSTYHSEPDGAEDRHLRHGAIVYGAPRRSSMVDTK